MSNRWAKTENGETSAKRMLEWFKYKSGSRPRQDPLSIVYVNYNHLKFNYKKSLYDVINDRFNLGFDNPNKEVKEFLKGYSKGSLVIVITNLAADIGKVHKSVYELFTNDTPMPNAKIIVIMDENLDQTRLENRNIFWCNIKLMKYKLTAKESWNQFSVIDTINLARTPRRPPGVEIEDIPGDTRGFIVNSNVCHVLKFVNNISILTSVEFIKEGNEVKATTVEQIHIPRDLYGIHKLSTGEYVSVTGGNLVLFTSDQDINEKKLTYAVNTKNKTIRTCCPNKETHKRKEMELRDVTVYNDEIYVVDKANDCCYKVKLENEKAIICLTIGRGQLKDPSSIAVNENEDIIVTETSSIKAFASDGVTLQREDEVPNLFPQILACNSQGKILVHMRGRHELHLCDSDFTSRVIYYDKQDVQEVGFTPDDMVIFLNKIGDKYYLNLL